MERVQKILAQVGIASRRKAEELITQGVVTINGKTAKLGDKADFGKDAIKVNGKLLRTTQTQTPVYIALYKPRGVISMLSDPEGRPTLADFLPKVRERVFPIGRLDYNSEGLILLTNDGALAELIQKRDDIARVYHVKVKGHPEKQMLHRLEKGARLDNKMVRPFSVRHAHAFTSKSLVEIVFMGSGTTDLKAYFEMKGFLVEKTTRVAIGHVSVRGLLPGQFKALKKSQMQALIDQPELGLKALEEAAAEARPQKIRTKIKAKDEDQPLHIRTRSKSS